MIISKISNHFKICYLQDRIKRMLRQRRKKVQRVSAVGFSGCLSIQKTFLLSYFHE